jgi:Spy/CpxP family protein refolding chaperone
MTRKFVFQVVVSLLALAMLASAQGQPQGRRRGEGGPPGAPGGPDPQQMLQQRIDFLASSLSLTEAQKTQATNLFTEAAKSAAPLQLQIRETRRSLQVAVRANNAEQIEKFAATIGTLTGQSTAITSKAEAQFIGSLTAEQQGKLPESGLMMFGGGGGPGGPGGRRPQQQ